MYMNMCIGTSAERIDVILLVCLLAFAMLGGP